MKHPHDLTGANNTPDNLDWDTVNRVNQALDKANKQILDVGGRTPLQQECINKGYKEYVGEHYRTFKSTNTLYQKCIKDEAGKRYYIDLWYYPEFTSGTYTPPESIQAEVQFTGDGITEENMNVQLFVKDIDTIEKVFDTMWEKLDLGYYEIWGE